MNIKKLTLLAGLTLALVIGLVCINPKALAMAPAGYSLFGDAVLTSPGNASQTAAQLTSVGVLTYSGVDFKVPAGLTVANLNNLATDYKFTAGGCGGGSPKRKGDPKWAALFFITPK